MRNAVIARDTVAQAAGIEVLANGGTAVDAVLAALLAGATRASAASLLGSAGILVAGPGVGWHYVDGRARAPGLGEKRGKTPDAPPPSWRAVVPGLLEAVLATTARFGTMPLASVVRAAVGALREAGMDDGTRARIKLLNDLQRSGISALERLGVVQGILAGAGASAGGLFTREDLVPVGAPVCTLVACSDGDDEVLLPPRGMHRRGPQAPADPPTVDVESVVAMDLHGVTAVAGWLVAPEAAPVEGVEGLALAGLLQPSRKGVPRWRPGAPVSCPMPLAVLVREGRAWAGLGVSGGGAVDGARDRAVSARMAAAGLKLAVGEDDAAARVHNAVALWAVRETDGDDVRTTTVAL